MHFKEHTHFKFFHFSVVNRIFTLDDVIMAFVCLPSAFCNLIRGSRAPDLSMEPVWTLQQSCLLDQFLTDGFVRYTVD